MDWRLLTSLELDREFKAGSLRGFADDKGSFSYFGPAALVSGLVDVWRAVCLGGYADCALLPSFLFLRLLAMG
jgi:hypothetical protein